MINLSRKLPLGGVDKSCWAERQDGRLAFALDGVEFDSHLGGRNRIAPDF
jgi:hypothetical protein